MLTAPSPPPQTPRLTPARYTDSQTMHQSAPRRLSNESCSTGGNGKARGRTETQRVVLRSSHSRPSAVETLRFQLFFCRSLVV